MCEHKERVRGYTNSGYSMVTKAWKARAVICGGRRIGLSSVAPSVCEESPLGSEKRAVK